MWEYESPLRWIMLRTSINLQLVGTTNSAIVIVNLANIRIGPGTSYRVVDTAPNWILLSGEWPNR